MYPIMENLINNKCYATADEIYKKLKLFLDKGILTEDEYNKLKQLTELKYTE